MGVTKASELAKFIGAERIESPRLVSIAVSGSLLCRLRQMLFEDLALDYRVLTPQIQHGLRIVSKKEIHRNMAMFVYDDSSYKLGILRGDILHITKYENKLKLRKGRQ